MKQSYGLPYKGSKTCIAKSIVDFLPPADTFVDLFAGGCAVTHAAILSGKYKHFIANDIKSGLTNFFKLCATGDYTPPTEWVSRERFFQEKDEDYFVALCYSFGNDCYTYLYGKQIEPFKHAYHEAVFHKDVSFLSAIGISAPAFEDENDIHKRRLLYRKYFSQSKHTSNESEIAIQHAERMSRIEHLERLSRVENLCNSAPLIQALTPLSLDYREVVIPENSVIYCDIPYRGTQQYGKKKTTQDCIDYEAFYTWAAAQKNIFISEYAMPSDRFLCVWQKDRRSTLCATDNTLLRTEKIFIPAKNTCNPLS